MNKEELLEDWIEQGARVVFAQHILSGNKDERVRDYFNEQRYKNMKISLECANLELVNHNKELLNKIKLLELCAGFQDARIQGLDKDLSSYKQKYEIALKAIEELEVIIDKGHYTNKCCDKKRNN
jgi:hypothetical protein